MSARFSCSHTFHSPQATAFTTAAAFSAATTITILVQLYKFGGVFLQSGHNTDSGCKTDKAARHSDDSLALSVSYSIRVKSLDQIMKCVPQGTDIGGKLQRQTKGGEEGGGSELAISRRLMRRLSYCPRERTPVKRV